MTDVQKTWEVSATMQQIQRDDTSWGISNTFSWLTSWFPNVTTWVKKINCNSPCCYNHSSKRDCFVSMLCRLQLQDSTEDRKTNVELSIGSQECNEKQRAGIVKGTRP